MPEVEGSLQSAADFASVGEALAAQPETFPKEQACLQVVKQRAEWHAICSKLLDALELGLMRARDGYAAVASKTQDPRGTASGMLGDFVLGMQLVAPMAPMSAIFTIDEGDASQSTQHEETEHVIAIEYQTETI